MKGLIQMHEQNEDLEKNIMKLKNIFTAVGILLVICGVLLTSISIIGLISIYTSIISILFIFCAFPGIPAIIIGFALIKSSYLDVFRHRNKESDNTTQAPVKKDIQSSEPTGASNQLHMHISTDKSGGHTTTIYSPEMIAHNAKKPSIVIKSGSIQNEMRICSSCGQKSHPVKKHCNNCGMPFD